ncbi:MAG: FAD-dependent oxidoreductase [SAR202 cluster bacterium]|nr:FAD-dependent oxidoreductase [SAR202 cluster bacterium]
MNIAVVGAGVFGLSAALEARARGHAVTIFEQGKVPNPKASSTDVAKAVRRTGYGSKEAYVDLTELSAAAFRKLEARSGASFYHQTGLLSIVKDFRPGAPMHESWRYLTSRGAKLDVLTASEGRRRFPQFAVPDEATCLYDPWGGYAESGRAVECMARVAREEGAVINEHAQVDAVDDGPAAVVRYAGETAQFDRVIVAAGPWMKRLFTASVAPVTPTKQVMALIEPRDGALYAHGKMPVWVYAVEESGWYGFPMLREGFVKFALGDLRNPEVDPDVDRTAPAGFEARAMEFARMRLPDLAKGKLLECRACLYETTPDDHFLIDWVPGSQRILIAGGGSGHGFKFGGSIGGVILDALEDRRNRYGDLFRAGERFEKPPIARTETQLRGFH